MNLKWKRTKIDFDNCYRAELNDDIEFQIESDGTDFVCWYLRCGWNEEILRTKTLKSAKCACQEIADTIEKWSGK